MFITDDVFQIYANSLRAALFSGFLTLTGFLFSMKTFLLANLYRDVYSRPEYKEILKAAKRIDSRVGKASNPLRNISRILLATICSTLLASLSQVTLGLWNTKETAEICLGFAAGASIMVIVAIVVLSLAVRDWMNVLDKEIVASEENAKEE